MKARNSHECRLSGCWTRATGWSEGWAGAECVYKATDISLERAVAIKVTRADN